MTSRGRLLAGCVTALLFVYVRGSDPINFTTNQVISSHDYDRPYPSKVNQTWTWHSESGLWGIKFLDVDLTDTDSLIIWDFKSNPIYINRPHGRLDTSGPKLMITFQSDASKPKGRGFKLDVRHGANKVDLDMKFLEGVKPPTITSPNPDMGLFLPILLVIATIMLLLFAILVWFICSRRRRRQQQQVSLSVNVEGGIRRDSGVRYTRKPSTMSQSEDPPSPRKTTQLVRSNSNRSWMVRAELTATSPSTPAGGCNGNGKAHTVSNVYTPMESDREELSGKVSVHVRDPISGRANEVFRTRAPTLERVPEDELMTRVPAASSLDVSQDDGYLGPSPKCPAIAYLNCPVSGSGEVAKYDFPISSRSCEDGYQNITVTGRVGIS